jgi:hypothetical protein
MATIGIRMPVRVARSCMPIYGRVDGNLCDAV